MERLLAHWSSDCGEKPTFLLDRFIMKQTAPRFYRKRDRIVSGLVDNWLAPQLGCKIGARVPEC